MSSRRVFALIFLPAALPLCISTAVGIGTARASLEAMSRERLEGDAQNLGAAVETWMDDRQRFAEVLAGYPELARLSDAEQLRLLSGAAERHPGVLTISLIGPDGTQRVRSDGLPLQDVGDRAYFQEAMRGGAALESVVRRADGRPSVVVAVPVVVEGVPRQVLIVSTDVARLGQIMNGANVRGGAAAVVDPAGRVVSQAAAPVFLDAAGHDWTASIALPHGFRLVVQRPRDDAQSGSPAAPRVSVYVSLGLLVLCAWTARRCSRLLTLSPARPTAPGPRDEG